MYQFRFATKDDYNFLYNLNENTMKEYYIETYGSWDEEVERNFFDESFNSIKYLIILIDGQDIGCLAVTRNNADIFINEIQILSQYQNKGIGKMILDSIINDSQRLKIPINLEVLKVNKRAQAFYDRIGFIKSGETDSHYIMRRDPTISFIGKE